MNNNTKITLLAAILTTPIAYAYNNEPTGFRNITWGDPPNLNIEEFKEVESHPDLKFYHKVNDNLSIGGASLQRITYGYYKDKFYSVLIDSKGASNREPLIQAFKEQFGPPLKPNRFMDKYIWTGPITNIILLCKSYGDCSATMVSKTISKEKAENEKLIAQDAAKDF